jgi:hypothetical protein
MHDIYMVEYLKSEKSHKWHGCLFVGGGVFYGGIVGNHLFLAGI